MPHHPPHWDQSSTNVYVSHIGIIDIIGKSRNRTMS